MVSSFWCAYGPESRNVIAETAESNGGDMNMQDQSMNEFCGLPFNTYVRSKDYKYAYTRLSKPDLQSLW